MTEEVKDEVKAEPVKPARKPREKVRYKAEAAPEVTQEVTPQETPTIVIREVTPAQPTRVLNPRTIAEMERGQRALRELRAARKK